MHSKCKGGWTSTCICVTTDDMILKYLGKQNPKAIMTRYTENVGFYKSMVPPHLRNLLTSQILMNKKKTFTKAVETCELLFALIN